MTKARTTKGTWPMKDLWCVLFPGLCVSCFHCSSCSFPVSPHLTCISVNDTIRLLTTFMRLSSNDNRKKKRRRKKKEERNCKLTISNLDSPQEDHPAGPP